MDYRDYCWGLYRDYYRDPFPNTLLSTTKSRLWGWLLDTTICEPEIEGKSLCLNVRDSHSKAPIGTLNSSARPLLPGAL